MVFLTAVRCPVADLIFSVHHKHRAADFTDLRLERRQKRR